MIDISAIFDQAYAMIDYLHDSETINVALTAVSYLSAGLLAIMMLMPLFSNKE